VVEWKVTITWCGLQWNHAQKMDTAYFSIVYRHFLPHTSMNRGVLVFDFRRIVIMYLRQEVSY